MSLISLSFFTTLQLVSAKIFLNCSMLPSIFVIYEYKFFVYVSFVNLEICNTRANYMVAGAEFMARINVTY